MERPPSSGRDQSVQERRGGDGGAAGKMGDLQAAREAGGDDRDVGTGRAQGGEETLLADETRDLIVLGLVAERAGQAAAAGVEVDHLAPRDSTQQTEHRAHPDERALMAVALDEQAP